MQTLVLISFYGPVVIIMFAILAVVFSFLLAFPTGAGLDAERDGASIDSRLALARAKYDREKPSNRSEDASG